ncbi:hypothetical protein EHP00_2699 [Ecytonucleospora hepatopenaei]|uniref:Uncharacterized protein n=1 Tax=Ecytonucleospora hepatopenaei TaxID=646526 RepID=A0A1W0E606_9MICR|nr:hypothetical protein EHP00_768 [Ecytonucleospora hepatopenaei]OQS55308.1 hypothetical protein EHP00_2699 [Ecytonucleospora hepatopenaei]
MYFSFCFILLSFCTREKLRLERETWIKIDTLTTSVNVMEFELKTLSEKSIIKNYEDRVKRYLDLHGNMLAIKKLYIDKTISLNQASAKKLVQIDCVFCNIISYLKFDFYEIFLNELEVNAENAEKKEKTKQKIRKIHNSLTVLSSAITFLITDFPTIQQDDVKNFKSLLDEQAIKLTEIL